MKIEFNCLYIVSDDDVLTYQCLNLVLWCKGISKPCCGSFFPKEVISN